MIAVPLVDHAADHLGVDIEVVMYQGVAQADNLVPVKVSGKSWPRRARSIRCDVRFSSDLSVSRYRSAWEQVATMS